MRRTALTAALIVAGVMAVAAIAWACVPAGGLFVTPWTGPAGSQATVTGRQAPGPVDLYWDRDPKDTSGPPGPKLNSTPIEPTPLSPDGHSGGEFTYQITIPANASPGCHNIVALHQGSTGDIRSVAVFAVGQDTCNVVRPEAPPVVTPAPQAQAVTPTGPGPRISGAALSKANGTITVSRSGRFTLFCGRFSEAGVTGVCGGQSAKSIGSRRAGRSGVKLQLGTKEFLSQPGRATNVKFRLNRGNLALLKAANRVPMRGTVEAVDVFGNASKANFSFTLKEPK